LIARRISTAILLLALTGTVLSYENAKYLPLLFLTFHLGILWEWLSLLRQIIVVKIIFLIIFTLNFVGYFIYNTPETIVLLLQILNLIFWLFVVPVFVVYVFCHSGAVGCLTSFFCCSVSLISWLGLMEKGVMFLLSVLTIVWLTDISAFLFGKLLGKKKLHVRVSPNKTVEGVIGAFAVTAAGALILGLWGFGWYGYFLNSFGIFGLLVLTIIFVFISVNADLFESLLKRKAAVKDSGKLLPGHGGLFDRFDSSIAIGPVVAVFATFI
tara:strand:- start:19088 stop:19894 length:807 start_codon:yes stop_codon:yes gene_type:complete